MNPKHKILALIPARGGSKGLPNKNIREFGGLPLIAHTINTAIDCHFFHKVVVSTDSDKIASISKKHGAEIPFIRPEEISKDDSTTLSVVKHAISFFLEKKEIFDAIIVLQPTTPFREVEVLKIALDKFLDNTSDSVVSICKSGENPYWSKKIVDGNLVPVIDDNLNYNRRQDLPPTFRINGSIYIVGNDVLKRDTLLGERVETVTMNAYYSIDIDTYLDFVIAEKLLGVEINE